MIDLGLNQFDATGYSHGKKKKKRREGNANEVITSTGITIVERRIKQ